MWKFWIWKEKKVISVEGHLHHSDEMIAAFMWSLFSGRIYICMYVYVLYL